MRLFLGIILVVPFLLYAGIRIWRAEVSFQQDCGGHMGLAASANSVELARDEMRIIVKYLEDNQMTSGYTSVLYRTPDEDVGFWYKNMKASLTELEAVAPDTSNLERSNILIKLHESLITHGEKSKIRVPDGITVFPNNVGWALFGIVGLILAVIGALLIVDFFTNEY